MSSDHGHRNQEAAGGLTPPHNFLKQSAESPPPPSKNSKEIALLVRVGEISRSVAGRMGPEGAVPRVRKSF